MTRPGNSVVIVTGGSAGIGRATVARLAAAGVRVVTCARDGDRLDEAIDGLPGVTAIAADMAPSGWRAATDTRRSRTPTRADGCRGASHRSGWPSRSPGA